jgi:HSP20 family protein
MFWPTLRMGSWDPLAQVRRMQREMDRMFRGTYEGLTSEFPAMNIWTSGDDVLVTAEVPGLKAEDLDISVLGDTLTVRGTRRPEELKEGELFHRRERGYGDFVRTIQMPYRVDSGKVEARYEKGILRITLPRSEEDKPRKIKLHQ